MKDRSAMTVWDRFFFYLDRVNAVGFALVVAFAGWLVIDAYWSQIRWETSYDDVEFGHAREEPETDYQGDEYEGPQGTVTAYRFGPMPNVDEGIKSTGINFVELATGRSLRVLPENSGRVISDIEFVENDGVRVGYIARTSTETEYAEGLSDLIIGSFYEMRQVTLAENASYLDSNEIIRGDKLALLFWPDDNQVNLAVIDLRNLSDRSIGSVSIPARTIVE